MARKRIVSRTVKGTFVSFISLDIASNQTSSATAYIYGDYATNDKLLKAVKKFYDNSEHIALYVTASEPFYKRFGMDESKFLELAEELPLLPGSFTEEE